MPIVLFLMLSGCATPSSVAENNPELVTKSTKTQAELVGCIATAWADRHLTLATIPTAEKTTVTLSGLYGTEARADIYTDSRVEVRIRNSPIKGQRPMVRDVQRCL